MTKKRIILIRNAKSYDFGGGERFPVFAAEILAKQDYEPIIVSRSKKLLDFANHKNLITIKGLWWSHQNWSGPCILLFPAYVVWQLILTIWYLTLFIRLSPFVIHIQSKDDFIAATLAGRLLGKRILWTDHADLKHIWKNITTWYKNPVGKLVYFSAHFAHAISVVSKSEFTLVTGNIPQESHINNKLHVIYNGVLDTASDFPKKTLDDVLTFCVASRLVTDKGIREVIEAYKQVQPSIQSSQLLLMGDGPEVVHFKELAKDTPSIVFLGHQTEPLKILAQADIFVHPTYHEGFSVALVEAGMLGLPIIATSVGGNVEIITDNKTGLLVSARKSNELAQAMQRLADNKTLRDELGAAARQQYIDHFQFNVIINQSFIPLYEGHTL